MGGVIQSADEGQIENYFYPLVFAKGLQCAIIWTDGCLNYVEKQFLYKIKEFERLNLIL